MRGVTIVILHWPRTEKLEKMSINCIESVLANTKYKNYEILVVHNKCAERPGGDYLLTKKHPRLRVVENDTNQGFIRGNNQGMLLAGENDVLLLNNDTEVPKGWLTPMMSILEDDKTAGMVLPKQFHTGSTEYKALEKAPQYTSPETQGVAWERPKVIDAMLETCVKSIELHNMIGHHCGPMTEGNWMPLCATLIRREVIEKVGLLDEAFLMGGFEDVDYSWRVSDAGYKLYLCNTTAIWHYYGQSFPNLQGQSEVWIETGKYLLSKHDAKQTIENAVYRFKDKSKGWFDKNKHRIKPEDLADFEAHFSCES